VLCACLLSALPRNCAYAQELERRGSAPARSTPGPVSIAHLTPPLHSRLRALRFSPNGRYILLQDESAIYVLARSPLAIMLSLSARLALPVRFSADSTSIVVALQNMRAQRTNIESEEPAAARIFGAGNDCYAAALSPNGELYACLTMESRLQVFRVDSGDLLFDGPLGDTQNSAGRTVLPFHTGLPFSEPFGYFVGGLVPPSIDRAAASLNLRFSPDGRYLITVSTWGTITAVDLQTRKKINIGGSLRRAVERGALEFVADDRAVYVAPDKADDSALLSFPEGRTLAKLSVTGSARATSDPRYLIHISPDGQDAEVLDLQTLNAVSKISKDGGDVFGGEIISYAADAGLSINRLGTAYPKILARVPAGPLPVLRTAMASPDLESLALGVTGQGGVYRVSNGTQIASFPGLRGAQFDGEQDCYLRVPQSQSLASNLERLNTSTGASESLWPIEETRIRDEHLFSGPVILSEVMDQMYADLESLRFGYNLRALDLRAGKTLWSRDFGGGLGRTRGGTGGIVAPVTFTDPQGDRVVLGWEANSDAARVAAKHSTVAQQNMKQAKVTARDTVFEVLNGGTGNTEGAVFVPGGSGPRGYTSAYSTGDWLVAVKDYVRVTVVSLTDGDERLRVTAMIPALNAKAGLLAVAQEGGRLLVYDLQSATRRNEFALPNEVVYLRFSANGKRLLALTQDQTVNIFDVSVATATSSAVSP
jgi:hypothetical protein